MAGTAASPTTIEARQHVPDLSFMFTQAGFVLTTQMTAALEAVGLTPRDYCVLSKARAGDFTQIEIAHASGLDKTTMVNVLDNLERAGLAERRPDLGDRRVRRVVVTAGGAAKLAEAAAIVDEVHRRVLDVLPADQRRALVDALTRLVERELAEPAACSQPPRRTRR